MKAALAFRRETNESMTAQQVKASVEPPARAKASAQPPSRAGLKAIQCYVDPAAHEQLAILAIREKSSIQQLVADALDQLFASRGLPTIAARPLPKDDGTA